MSDPIDLLSLSRIELQQWVEMTDKRFRADQLYRWLWKQGARTFDEMSNLPASFRERLQNECKLQTISLSRTQTSADGTVKMLFLLASGRHVETVLIPDFDEEGDPSRLTVCVSSQVGCAMACSFCATGTMGFQQNLTSGEIVDQVRAANDVAVSTFGQRITNIVYMGMGEPMLNYDAVLGSVEKLTSEDGMGLAARRLTVSTVGLAGRIRQLAEEEYKVNLAVSLHSPFDDKRSSIMPINRKAKTDLTALMESIEFYTQTTGRGITYEYCMFEGFNDSVADAAELSKLVSRAPSKVNLIMYNSVSGLGFNQSSENNLNLFIARLVKDRVRVTVRRSRGQDIDAACGQLAVKHSTEV
ncbi:MAG: 23S rRNA (adenine(2503)-C(2))-methyltransferase RlmN [Bacteroidetes bacterium]|nr:23S rRNA (adenine(2503)-C(2))-methyltransferase RlmN [Bacteroidota bacterium]